MALDESVSTVGVIILNSYYYSLWTPKMEDIIYYNDLHEPIVKEKIAMTIMWKNNGEC